ncbi:MAG: patatin-like phospholipase family protein [Chitinophagaceae bacterium]|nr:patatin-like phospholipase family protein [Chitinophagaceae bacterium]
MSFHQDRIGIALSGGGYRATAFHLGTLKKLEQLGILSRVNVISTISGGSITGACYCSRKGDFDAFYQDLYSGLQTKNVIKRILLSWMGLRFLVFLLLFIGSGYFLFTSYAWLFPIAIVLLLLVLLKFQFQLFPISKRIEQIYDEFFYQHFMLGQLPDQPTLVIGSTNLQTAKPFSFSKDWMQDSTYQYMDDPIKFKPAKYPLARAVMASSCVPFAFTPVTIDKEFFDDEAEAGKVHPVLVDGGVYDNQGIHKVMQSGQYNCGIVITSDAGCGSSGEMSFKNTFSLLMETVNVFMSRIKKSQMVRNVYDNASTVNKQVAYFSLGWDTENCISGFITNLDKQQITRFVIDAHQLKPEWVAAPRKYETEITTYLKNRLGYDAIPKPTPEEKKIARSVSTNLTALSKQEVDCLIKQAEALTELQVKLYCPSLFQ